MKLNKNKRQAWKILGSRIKTLRDGAQGNAPVQDDNLMGQNNEVESPAISRIETLRDDGRGKGFTLIELLVVILIIGILTAVALPQYQVAVMKSKTLRLLPLMKSIEEAQQVTLLTTGSYSINWNELDVSLPDGATIEEETRDSGLYKNKLIYQDFTCYLQTTSNRLTAFSLYCSSSDEDAPEIEKYFTRNYFICWGPGNLSSKACRSISGRSTPNHASSSRGGVVGYDF